MPKLIILGTANAIPDEKHDNTHMAVVGDERFILVDCVSNPIVRLRQAGLDVLRLTDLVLTHFHPDHVSGVPSLLMSSWLLGRKEPLNVYGLEYTLTRIKTVMDAYEWSNWPNFYPVNFVELPAQELVHVLHSSEINLLASPVKHIVPNIGLRAEFPLHGQSFAYSCDTEPCEQVVRLAQGVDVLIHEATGTNFGHSTAAQAGEIARRAGARQLYLIHYRTGDYDLGQMIGQAEETFGGPVRLSEDFMEIPFSG